MHLTNLVRPWRQRPVAVQALAVGVSVTVTTADVALGRRRLTTAVSYSRSPASAMRHFV